MPTAERVFGVGTFPGDGKSLEDQWHLCLLGCRGPATFSGSSSVPVGDSSVFTNRLLWLHHKGKPRRKLGAGTESRWLGHPKDGQRDLLGADGPGTLGKSGFPSAPSFGHSEVGKVH